MKRLLKAIEVINRTSEITFWVGALLCFGVIFILTIDICLRYLANRPTIWATDVSRYILVWGTFLGAAHLLEREEHISIDLLLGRLSHKARALAGVFVSIVTTLTCFLLFIYSTVTVWEHFQRGIIVADPVAWPKFIPLAGIPLGSFLLTSVSTGKMFQYLSRLRRGDEATTAL